MKLLVCSRTSTPDERVKAFKKRAERQLLVALHEATLGKPFEDIVFDEFERIEPPTARNIYLNICALHSLVLRFELALFHALRE